MAWTSFWKSRRAHSNVRSICCRRHRRRQAKESNVFLSSFILSRIPTSRDEKPPTIIYLSSTREYKHAGSRHNQPTSTPVRYAGHSVSCKRRHQESVVEYLPSAHSLHNCPSNHPLPKTPFTRNKTPERKNTLFKPHITSAVCTGYTATH